MALGPVAEPFNYRHGQPDCPLPTVPESFCERQGRRGRAGQHRQAARRVRHSRAAAATDGCVPDRIPASQAPTPGTLAPAGWLPQRGPAGHAAGSHDVSGARDAAPDAPDGRRRVSGLVQTQLCMQRWRPVHCSPARSASEQLAIACQDATQLRRAQRLEPALAA